MKIDDERLIKVFSWTS